MIAIFSVSRLCNLILKCGILCSSKLNQIHLYNICLLHINKVKRIIPLQSNVELGQLYDDNTGQFLDQSFFVKQIPERLIYKEPYRESSIGEDPKETHYEKLFDNIELESDQILSLLTGLVQPTGTMRLLDQITDNVYLRKASLYFSYTLSSHFIDITKNELAPIINKNYLATTNATHVLINIQYGMR